MSKKLVVLAAGAIAALAFSALPGFASAGEFNGTLCSGAPCAGTVESTSTATLEGAGGVSVKCNNTTGFAAQTNASSTGSVSLLFHECTEEVFHTDCHSAGQPSGTIATGTLVSHLVVLDTSPKTIGVLLTGVNETFSCLGGSLKRTVTGNVIGEITSPACGVASATTSYRFAAGASTGSQKWTQITTTGAEFDLTSDDDGSGFYESTSQTGEDKIRWGGNFILDC